MDIKKVFSKTLLNLRLDKGAEYTRQRVANDLGISRASLEYYEKGERTPDIVILSRIADYYDVTADYLLGRTPNTKTTDPEVSAICKLTGLSDNAVSILKSGYPDYNKTVNALFDDVESKDFDILGYSDCFGRSDNFNVPSVLEALFRYLCVARSKQSASWYIAKNGNIINSMSTDEKYINSNIEDINALTKLKDISINEVAEKILFDDVCTAIKRLKEHIELDVFEPTEETSEIIKKSSDDNYPF